MPKTTQDIRVPFEKKYHMHNHFPLDQKKEVLKLWADAYYNDDPVVTDEVFDMWVGVVNNDASEAGEQPFKQLRAPVKGVDDGLPQTTESKGAKSVPVPNTPEPIGSLTKVRPFQVTTHTHKELLAKCVVSLKYDGLTLLLEYRDCTLIGAYTGGDEVKTLDVLHTVLHMPSIPKTITSKRHLFIRGEAVVSKANFEKYAKPKGFKFHRGFVNGTLRGSNQDDAKLLDFVAFKLLMSPKSAPKTFTKELSILKRLTFQVIPHELAQPTEDYCTAKLNKLDDHPYYCDGIVLMPIDMTMYREAGFKDFKPLAAFSVKLPQTEQAAQITRCTKIEWTTSKDGNLIPVIHYEARDFNGKTNDRATANNATWLEERKIGVGSKLQIIQSGDVIPHIVKAKPSKNFTLPTHCTCGAEAIEKGRHLACVLSTDCPAGEAARLHHYCTTLGFDSIGYATCEAMLETFKFDTLMNPPKDFQENLTLLEGFAETSATTIAAQLNQRSHPVAKLMVASNLYPSIGEKTIAKVRDVYPKFPRQVVTEEQLLDIKGIGKATAKAFFDNQAAFKAWVGKHFFRPIMKLDKEDELESNKLEGQRFVFTMYRDEELEKLIKGHGGTVGALTKTTTALFCGGKSKKLEQAESYGIKVIEPKHARAFVASLLDA